MEIRFTPPTGTGAGYPAPTTIQIPEENSKTDLLSLEERANINWGSSWTIVRVVHNLENRWFWYCGIEPVSGEWSNSGLTDTIEDALRIIISLDSSM